MTNVDPTLSIVIPTYGREQVLLDSVSMLLRQSDEFRDLLIVDQTPLHERTVEQQLLAWDAAGSIRWIRRESPGIPQAMNAGLMLAQGDLVLFLDDDIVPVDTLVREHRVAHRHYPVTAVVGQVIQPWQQPETIVAPRLHQGLEADFDFPFHSTISAPVQNVMAGNLSVVRQRAIQLGGFDERFVGSAYRFETEFARRLGRAGDQIWFSAEASIKHLRVPSGGTRQRGDHRASADPKHGVGDYYFALQHGSPAETWRYPLRRLFREVCTKFHLRYPWYIPVKLLGEIRAWLWARQLSHAGPELIELSLRESILNHTQVIE